MINKKFGRRNFVKLSTGGIISDGDSSGNTFAKEASKQTQSGSKPIRIGFVGIGGRGSYHLNAALGIEGVEVPALCELNPVRLYKAKRWVEGSGLPTPRLYDRGPADFKRMCEQEDLDLIICCTPWEFHAQVAITAMKNNKNLVSEVPEYEHPVVKNYIPPPRRGGKIEGHGGGGTETPLIWHRLVTALRENKLPDWDVYDSVTSSAISPITEASVANRGKAIDFPDFSKGKWKTNPKIILA